MEPEPFLHDEFTTAVRAAGARARIATLAAGIPVFYRDPTLKVDIMEEPTGRKFEIRFFNSGSSDQNYEVLRELDEPAA